MFTQSCFIRKNTPELRDKLDKLGYRICSCCKFKDNIWLNNFLVIKNDPSIHGIGAWDIEDSQEEALNLYITENANKPNPAIDCGTNEELFLAIAALRDDTDENQWFISNVDIFTECYNSEWKLYEEWRNIFTIEDLNSEISPIRKATVEEIIEQFK